MLTTTPTPMRQPLVSIAHQRAIVTLVISPVISTIVGKPNMRQLTKLFILSITSLSLQLHQTLTLKFIVTQPERWIDGTHQILHPVEVTFTWAGAQETRLVFRLLIETSSFGQKFTERRSVFKIIIKLLDIFFANARWKPPWLFMTLNLFIYYFISKNHDIFKLLCILISLFHGSKVIVNFLFWLNVWKSWCKSRKHTPLLSFIC